MLFLPWLRSTDFSHFSHLRLPSSVHTTYRPLQDSAASRTVVLQRGTVCHQPCMRTCHWLHLRQTWKRIFSNVRNDFQRSPGNVAVVSRDISDFTYLLTYLLTYWTGYSRLNGFCFKLFFAIFLWWFYLFFKGRMPFLSPNQQCQSIDTSGLQLIIVSFYLNDWIF